MIESTSQHRDIKVSRTSPSLLCSPTVTHDSGTAHVGCIPQSTWSHEIPHRPSPPCIAQYRPASPRTTLHCPTPPCIVPHHPASPHATLHRPAPPCIAPRHPASSHATLYSRALPCNTLHRPARAAPPCSASPRASSPHTAHRSHLTTPNRATSHIPHSRCTILPRLTPPHAMRRTAPHRPAMSRNIALTAPHPPRPTPHHPASSHRATSSPSSPRRAA